MGGRRERRKKDGEMEMKEREGNGGRKGGRKKGARGL
jgi:hypothetical protein